MFDKLGRLAVRHPLKLCSAWLGVAVLLTVLAPSWQAASQDDDIRFLPPHYPSVRGYSLLSQAFPKDVFASRMVFAIERPGEPLTPADWLVVNRLIARLERLRQEEPGLQISGVNSYRDPVSGGRLTSQDRRCTLIPVALNTPYLAMQTRLTVDRAEAVMHEELGPNSPLNIYTTGAAGVGRDLVRASTESLDHTTWATILLVVGVLLIVYRSPLLALIPLVTIGVASWVAIQLLAYAACVPGVQLVNISQVFAIVILFGAGTDYCLFLISRYREELETGEVSAVGVQRAVRAVGGALVASAATVICGLGMMGFAEFGKIRSAGPVIALALIVGLVASLTLTPALLRLLGKRAFWPLSVEVRMPGRQRHDFWHYVAGGVVARPVTAWVLALLPLMPMAIIGMRVVPTFKPTGDLSPTATSVLGLAAIQRHFAAGETGPNTILLASEVDWRTNTGRDRIEQFAMGLSTLENVAEVRCLTRPLGKPAEPPPPVTAGMFGGLRLNLADVFGQAARKGAENHYVAELSGNPSERFVTRLDVIVKSDPFDDDSVATLEIIEAWLHGILPKQSSETFTLRAECYGVTVQTRDLAEVVMRDRDRVNTLVLLGVFLILLLLVRRGWLATYLLATVLLSYFATLGMTAVFAHYWIGKPWGQIEWRVPFFLFTILIAVGEDYNILVVTRILQERKRLGLIEGVRRGLATTGGTITACGVIMAGTFATLMLSGLSTLVQIGFALAFGVLLDTLIVRPVLVPAFMLWVGQLRTPIDQSREDKPSVTNRPSRAA